jgi:hypothetical protein
MHANSLYPRLARVLHFLTRFLSTHPFVAAAGLPPELPSTSNKVNEILIILIFDGASFFLWGLHFGHFRGGARELKTKRFRGFYL